MMNQPIRILYVDDYQLDRELVRDVLTRENNEFELIEAASRAEFEAAFARGGFDVVLSDFNILGFEGLQVLEAVRAKDAEIPIIIVTGTGSEEVAVEAMKRGAADYVIKKIHHLQRLPLTIKAVLEKQQAERERRDIESRYRLIFENSGEAILLTHPDGTIYSANPEACRIFQWSEAEITKLGRQGLEDPNDPRLSRALEEIRKTGIFRGELNLVRKDGTIFPAEISSTLFKDVSGNECTSMIVRDITERRRAEQALRESEARHRSLFMSLSEGFAYHEIILDREGQPVDYRFLELNPAFEQMTGLVREQVVGRTVREVLPDIEDFWIETYGKVALTGSPIQFQHYTEALEKYYNVVAYSPEKDRFAALFIDVTDQVRAEAQAQALKTELEVHHRLIDLRERERVQLARELHDGPLQGLMALGFDLQQVATDVAGQPVERPIRDMQTSLQSEIDKLRSYAGELRSPVLYKFGLAKAISAHLETFGEKHPELALRVQTDADDEAVPQPVRSGLFRIYQEALNNIVAHARATRVEIQLTQTDRSLQLEISDDGQGFTLPQDWLDLVRSGHYGLVGMRERAESLGGRAEIISHPGDGTRVWVNVPL